MDTLRMIATLLPLAVGSGINLYATILVAGICIRLGWVQNTPPGLDVLATWPVLIAAGAFYAVEFLADKIPFVDNAWDMIHTFVRPLGAAILAVAALGSADPAVVVIAAMASGGLALASHAGKASSRMALNVASPVENASNTVVSIGEDLAVGALTVLALQYPLVAAGLAIVILVAMALIAPRLLGGAMFLVRALAATLRSWFRQAGGQPPAADTLPTEHRALIDAADPRLVAECRAQRVPGAGGKPGYVVVSHGHLTYTWGKGAAARCWQISRSALQPARLQRRALVDVVEVGYADEKARARRAYFVFFKDRGWAATQLADLLQAT